MRGGSFYHDSGFARISYDRRYTQRDGIGFRVIRTKVVFHDLRGESWCNSGSGLRAENFCSALKKYNCSGFRVVRHTNEQASLHRMQEGWARVRLQGQGTIGAVDSDSGG